MQSGIIYGPGRRLCRQCHGGYLISVVISDSQLLLVCGGRFPTTCTPECRHLLTTELGCCANNNDNYLWTLCDVGFVAEQCGSTINSSQTQRDPNCTDESYNQQIFRNVFCRRQYFESAINVTPDFCGIEPPSDACEAMRKAGIASPSQNWKQIL